MTIACLPRPLPGKDHRPALHAEPRAPHGLDRSSSPSHLNVRSLPSPEEVEQQLPRQPGDPSCGVSPFDVNDLRVPNPLKLKSGTSQAPCEEPRRATDVAPQGLVHRLAHGSRTTPVGPAHVLVVNEELIEIRDPAHPANPEEARRRSQSNRLNEPGKVLHRERLPAPFGKATPCTRNDEPGSRKRVVLAHDEVCGKIPGRPGFEESRRIRTELLEQAADLRSLTGVEDHVPSARHTGPPLVDRPSVDPTSPHVPQPGVPNGLRCRGGKRLSREATQYGVGDVGEVLTVDCGRWPSRRPARVP